MLLLPAQSAVDQAASVLLADLLKKRGVTPSVVPHDQTRRASHSMPCGSTPGLSASHPSSARSRVAAVRYLIRRWRRALPDARFLACFWRPDQDSGNMEELRKKVGADLIATSLKDAAEICCDEMKASISKGRNAIHDRSALAG